MKQIFITVVFAIVCISAHAQSGFSTNAYYNKRFTISNIPVSYVYPKFDVWGNFIGNFQMVRHAEWHSDQGGQQVTVWTSYGWQTRWQEGYYYWFEWIDIEIRV